MGFSVMLYKVPKNWCLPKTGALTVTSIRCWDNSANQPIILRGNISNVHDVLEGIIVYEAAIHSVVINYRKDKGTVVCFYSLGLRSKIIDY